ncbi:MAG: mevalonate kinase [Myxococcales bacterium]|nr:mevalonate kinase [Myxococcales bacterium]
MGSVGKAPGKLILCGEHAVVEGHWAIAAALPRLTTVTLTPHAGPTTLADQPDRLEKSDQRLLPALLKIVPAHGFRIGIRSELPIGCGLGSSAALAIATLRAMASVEHRDIGFQELHERGFAVERAFHGNPSGVDHAVSAFGGVVRYRRAGPAPQMEALALVSPLTLVVLNTGPPAFTTAEMVARVRARGSARELEAIGEVVERIRLAITSGPLNARAFGGLLDENHELLRAIGVSTPALDRACDLLRQAGATGAKLAGAGGGGVAFGACSPENAPALEAAASASGLQAFTVRIGESPK